MRKLWHLILAAHKRLAILLFSMRWNPSSPGFYCGEPMTRFRMSPLGAAINLTLLVAAVAFWYWRRRNKALAAESAKAFPQPLTPAS